MLVFSALACQGEMRKPPAAPRASVTRPIVYLPADLDLVLRLNVQNYRETMGPDPELSLERLWESYGPEAADWSFDHSSASAADVHEPLIKLLKSCDSMWLGCRLTEKGCRDFVFVLRGQWNGDHRSYGFMAERNKRDLGGGWLSFDFAAPRRSSIARLYWRAPELAVLVSSGELDSTERALEKSSDPTPLEPSELGMLSLVARSSGLARLLGSRSPKAAQWLEQSERVEIRFEPSSLGTIATFTVVFNDENRAKRSAEAFRILVTAIAGFESRFKASNVLLEQLGTHVVLRVTIPSEERRHETP